MAFRRIRWDFPDIDDGTKSERQSIRILSLNEGDRISEAKDLAERIPTRRYYVRVSRIYGTIDGKLKDSEIPRLRRKKMPADRYPQSINWEGAR